MKYRVTETVVYEFESASDIDDVEADWCDTTMSDHFVAVTDREFEPITEEKA